jgi:hypothetical protein
MLALRPLNAVNHDELNAWESLGCARFSAGPQRPS